MGQEGVKVRDRIIKSQLKSRQKRIIEALGLNRLKLKVLLCDLTCSKLKKPKALFVVIEI